MDSLKEKLERQVKEVLDDPSGHKDEISYLMTHLGLKRDEVVRAYVAYNLDVSSYDNEIYRPVVNRIVLHLHNLLPGGWHEGRQEKICEIVRAHAPRSIVDIGFGTPSRYVLEEASISKTPLTLMDKYESAITFAKALLNYRCANWRNNIGLQRHDMDNVEYPGDADLYLLLDSLEHAKNPERYLEILVRNSPHTAKFVLSLPIGPAPATHFIEWENDGAARSWLKSSGLRTMQEDIIYPNLQVDLFAQQLPEVHNILALCEKHRCVV